MKKLILALLLASTAFSQAVMPEGAAISGSIV